MKATIRLAHCGMRTLPHLGAAAGVAQRAAVQLPGVLPAGERDWQSAAAQEANAGERGRQSLH